ncbi:MAG: type IV secretion system protein [Pseudomonadota bacterium]
MASTPTPHQSGMSFMSAAAAFEKSRIAEVEQSRTIAWRVAYGSGIAAILAIAAFCLMTPLKTAVPYVIRVDNHTGATDIVTVLKDAKNTYGEVTDKYFLAQYVRYRENYDWDTIQATYDATNLLSSNAVQSEFKLFYDKPDAPHKILRDKSKVSVTINAITFIGEVAQIRFEKNTLPVGGQSTPSTPVRLIATIAYKYENTPIKEKDRLINPLGFQVTSYRVDPENAPQVVGERS